MLFFFYICVIILKKNKNQALIDDKSGLWESFAKFSRPSFFPLLVLILNLSFTSSRKYIFTKNKSLACVLLSF